MSKSKVEPHVPASILVVDDTRANLRLLVGILTEHGYKVRPAMNGRVALAAAQAEPPDLILLDIMMPEMDGYEVCEQLKADERTRDIPLIFISAMSEVLDKVKAFSVGGVDYITKPFQVEEVLARVETHLTIGRLQKNLQEQNTRLQEENIRRMRVMEAFKDSRERYRLLAENSNDIISRQNTQGIYLYASPACRLLLGYKLEEIIGHYVFEFIHPQDLPAIQAIYENLAEQPPVSIITYRARRKDDHYIWLETTNKIIREPEMNTVAEIISVSRDVTERKQAEEILQTLNQRMQDELALAQEIQQSLLPPAHPDWSYPDVICYSVPVREVGGDFYHYHAFSSPGGRTEDKKGGRYAFAIGDVSGKGVSAALLMAASLAQFDAALSRKLTPSERMVYLDRAIYPYTQPRGQNCALCYVELDLAGLKNLSGLAKLHIVNAGCIPPYIRRTNGRVEYSDVGGFALGQGLGAETGYKQLTLNLSPGDMVILTSDGLVEAMNVNGELFGFERLERAIASGPTGNAVEMMTHLMSKIFEFIGQAEPYDDMTMIVVQV